MASESSLVGIRAAMIGGDAREHEILRQMLSAGMAVNAIGLPAGAEAILGRPQEVTVAGAATGARVLVLPIPGLGTDDSIYAPQWPHRLYLTAQDLALCAPRPVVIMGMASAWLKSILAAGGARLREYEQDDELMILRSRAIAEGTIRIAIENTDVTLHRCPVFLLGFGRVSMTLCGLLLAMRADLVVVARNAVQLARAWEMGAEPLHLRDLPEAISRARVIINTIPAKILTRDLLERTRREALIIDLVVPPGGVDFDAAKEMGRKTVWARGMGSRAPVTVGQSQWKGIRRMLLEELAES